MSNTVTSEERLAENEAFFREQNEKVAQGLTALNIEALNDHQGSHFDDDLQLQFRCECANESCHERIGMRLSEYRDIHEDRRRFIVVPGHDVSKVERVVKKTKAYHVVEKHDMPPEGGRYLKPTDLGT